MPVFRTLRNTLCIFGIILSPYTAVAAQNLNVSQSMKVPPSVAEMKYRYEMSVDVQAAYVRDTRADGLSDTAGRINLGGMFTSWVGLDALGMYKVKSKSYLIGGDIKLVPIDWFFLKVGGGAYADKETHEFKPTPIFGTGFVGRFSEYYYVVAEGTYFQIPDKRNNISFGVGFGTIF